MPANSETDIETCAGNTSEDQISSDAGLSSGEDDTSMVCHGGGKKPTPKKMATYESIPQREHHENFLRQCVEILLKDAVFEGTSRKNKVVEWQEPDEMLRMFDFALRDGPSSHDDLKEVVKQTVRYSVKTGHPYFMNQLFSCLDPYGLVGQWMTDALNPSVYTYEVTPVFIMMEQIVLEEMRYIVGFPKNGDGIFCPGGSMANGYAINCARYRKNPKIKETGLTGLQRMVAYASEESHYSLKKLASFLGLGSCNVYSIKTDGEGRMVVDHLREEIQRTLKEGAIPLIVSATAGTTVMGAFDDLEKIADVAKEFKIWMHVDAAWGGGALMSKRHRHLLKGIERADSMIWNPHKLLAVPQQCSVLLLKQDGLLAEAHSANAAYLFQKDKFYDTRYDTGDKHIQCGRRVDVLKFWFMWKAKGTSGFEKHVDRAFDNAAFFLEAIKKRPGFKLVIDNPQFTNICFWYIPPSLRGKEDEKGYNERLHKVAPKMKERMMKSGTMMISYQAQKSWPNFFRIVFNGSGLNHVDVLHIIENFDEVGCDL